MVLLVEAHVEDGQLQIKRYRCINLCQGKIKVLLRVLFLREICKFNHCTCDIMRISIYFARVTRNKK